MHKKFILAFVSTLILASASSMPASHAALVDKISAVVNNEVILLSDVERFERTIGLRKELDPLFGFSEALEKGHVENKTALEFLIQERLITQNFKIPDSDVEQEVQGIQRSNNLDRDQLIEFLRTKGFKYNEYFELMRVGLSKRNLLDREIRSRVNVSDDDVKNYYFNMAQQKNSAVPLEYSIQLIVINQSTYKNAKAAQDVAEGTLRSIREGESFADVAKRVSDDPSAASGGDLGYVAAEQLNEMLRSVARKLKIGEISPLIKAPGGYVIVKLVDARTSDFQKLNEQKEQIREMLAKDEYKKQLFIWAERAQNNAYVRVN